jgi:glucose/arabinose dehydrogenase
MSLGDGGPDPGEVSYRPADISNHGQRRDILWGKIIRLDVRGIDPNGVAPDCFGDVETPPYTIPADNPMVDGAGGMCDEIWSRGWRNPWRFSFDKVTGDMYIGEVGEERYEEVNRETAGTPGLNYGWPCYQGTYLHNSTCQGDYVFPEYQYNHDAGDCSIIGGFVYRGQTFPTLLGQYLFSDFCSRSIWRMPTLESGDVVEVLSGDGYPVWTAFGEDADGEMYIGGYLGGQVFKITEP